MWNSNAITFIKNCLRVWFCQSCRCFLAHRDSHLYWSLLPRDAIIIALILLSFILQQKYLCSVVVVDLRSSSTNSYVSRTGVSETEAAGERPGAILPGSITGCLRGWKPGQVTLPLPAPVPSSVKWGQLQHHPMGLL